MDDTVCHAIWTIEDMDRGTHVVGMTDRSKLTNQITQQVVCQRCYDEFMSGVTDARSLQAYSVLDVGFTPVGLQVWCRRHQANVCHIDFDGTQLDADFRSLENGQEA